MDSQKYMEIVNRFMLSFCLIAVYLDDVPKEVWIRLEERAVYFSNQIA